MTPIPDAHHVRTLWPLKLSNGALNLGPNFDCWKCQRFTWQFSSGRLCFCSSLQALKVRIAKLAFGVLRFTWIHAYRWSYIQRNYHNYDRRELQRERDSKNINSSAIHEISWKCVISPRWRERWAFATLCLQSLQTTWPHPLVSHAPPPPSIYGSR